jgi:phosphodiesterase/alkaline phosphatase D-like protein
MAITNWWLGRNSGTTATVVVRCDSTQSVTAAAGGNSAVAACNSSAYDGIAVATLTGLQPGTSYAYTLDGAAGGTLKTMPANGEFWLAFSSCWKITQPDILAYKLAQQYNLQGLFTLGDFPYMNAGGTWNGVSLTSIDGGTMAAGQDQANRYAYHRSQRRVPGIRDLMRVTPTYSTVDDHEYDPDNAQPQSLAWFQTEYPSATEGDRGLSMNAARNAVLAYYQGNPQDTGDTYFSVDIGNVTIWMTDLIWMRSRITATDNASKNLMTLTQRNWMLDGMAARPGRFHVWGNTKQMVSLCGRNADGWDAVGSNPGFKTELGAILSDARFPRSGCLSITGDEHLRGDIFVGANQITTGSAAVSQLSAGPATIDVITSPNEGLAYRNGVRDKERDTSGAANRGENNYVLLKVKADRIERYVLGSRYGLRYAGYVGLSDNAVRR